MTLIDQIRDMIAEGETEKSLQELYKYVKENNADVIDRLVMLRSRMQNMQNAIQNGTIDDQDASIERAKINEAILKLLPQLTPEYLAQANQSVRPMPQAVMSEKASAAPGSNRKKIYIIGGAVLLVVIILIMVINGGGGSDADIQETGSESLTTQQGTFLENVLANQAIWVSTDGQNTFQFESDKICHEIVNGQVINEFEVVGSDSDFINLHNPDPEIKMNLRIGINVTQYQYEGEEAWRDLYNGAWVIPSEGE